MNATVPLRAEASLPICRSCLILQVGNGPIVAGEPIQQVEQVVHSYENPGELLFVVAALALVNDVAQASCWLSPQLRWLSSNSLPRTQAGNRKRGSLANCPLRRSAFFSRTTCPSSPTSALRTVSRLGGFISAARAAPTGGGRGRVTLEYFFVVPSR